MLFLKYSSSVSEENFLLELQHQKIKTKNPVEE